MTLSRDPQLDPSDIKLLRIFVRVVESGGFSRAQAELDVSASTISSQMAALEVRLGMRLCDRGRVGFRLTEKGRKVYAAALRLQQAIDDVRSDIGQLRGKLVGDLHIGVIDSTISNTDFRLHEAINAFMSRDNAVHITIHVVEPAAIEQRLLDGRLSIGIGAFHHHVPGLSYEAVLSEAQGLYCGCKHPFFGRAPDRVSTHEVLEAHYVMRGYRDRQSAPFLGLKIAATAYDMEAVLTLIRSGCYIGHLPTHFAAEWVERGELLPLLPGRFSFVSEFEIAMRKGTGDWQVLGAFLREFRRAQGRQVADEYSQLIGTSS